MGALKTAPPPPIGMMHKAHGWSQARTLSRLLTTILFQNLSHVRWMRPDLMASPTQHLT
jgi:hypothetical protein